MSSDAEKKVADDLVKHIQLVSFYLEQLVGELRRRGTRHDESKFNEEHEFPLFVKYTPKLKDCEYGSDEYKQWLKELQPALEHHYQCNRHHPEHFPSRGIHGMNLIDVLEMLCDWLASTRRTANGDIFRSIEINQKRFGYSECMRNILENTAAFLIQKGRLDSVRESETGEQS